MKNPRRSFALFGGLALLILIVTIWLLPKESVSKADHANTADRVTKVSTRDEVSKQLSSGGGSSGESSAVDVPASQLAADASVFERFNDWTARYLAATPEQRREMLGEGMEIAKERRMELQKLIEMDPREAILNAVPPVVRQQLPYELAKLLEERVNEKAFYGVLGALPSAENPDTPAYRREVRTNDGGRYRAYVYGKRISQPTTENFPIVGIAVDESMAIDERPLRVVAPGEIPNHPNNMTRHRSVTVLDAQGFTAGRKISTEPDEPRDVVETCPVSGEVTEIQDNSVAVTEKDVVVEASGQFHVLCRGGHIESFEEQLMAREGGNGGPSMPTTPPSATQSTGYKSHLLMRVAFPEARRGSVTEKEGHDLAKNVQDWFLRSSYGSMTFMTTVTPLIILPRSEAWYKDQDTSGSAYEVLADARAAAKAAGFDPAAYNFDTVIYTGTPGSFGGQAYVGGKGCWLKSGTGTGVAVHEYGHNFGLWHANFWNTTNGSAIGGGSHVEYGDSFDTMGSASAGDLDFNANHKNQLNWIPNALVHDVTASGTYRIHQMDQPTQNPRLRYALKTRKDADRDYWVDLRQLFASNAWVQGGVFLHWSPWATSEGGAHLLDATPGSIDGKNDAPVVIGRTFSDTETGIHITPIAKNATVPPSMDVVVNLGMFPSNQAPVLSLGASATSVAANVPVEFTATASDGDGDALSYAWDFGDKSFSTTNSPTVSKSWATAGEYRVRCTVSDMKGKTTSSSVIVTVGSTTTFRIAGTITANGQPLANVRVHNSLTGTSYREAYTDSDGTYTLVRLSAGTYTVGTQLYGYNLTPTGSASVTVGPNASGVNFTATEQPQVSIVLQDADCSEGANTGTFRISRTGSTAAAMAVSLYAPSGSAAKGTDYTLLPDTVSVAPFLTLTIPAGQSFLDVLVTATDDTGIESFESAILELVPSTNYVLGNAVATLWIGDSDTANSLVRLRVTDRDAEESGDAGQFVIERFGSTSSALNVSVALSGTATNGTDYTSIPTTITIPSGASSIPVNLTPIQDTNVETMETAILTINTNAAYTRPASVADYSGTVNLHDDDQPILTVIATDSTASEVGGDVGVFTVTRTGSTAAALTVNYGITGSALHGTDYLALPGVLTIPAGSSQATVVITPIDDAIGEPAQTAVFQLRGGIGYTVGPDSNATVTINDNGDVPYATINVTTGPAIEGGTSGVFRVTTTGTGTGNVTVFYSVTGTATNGTDFTSLTGSLSIAKNTTSNITIAAIQDALVEGYETITVTLTPDAAYSLALDSSATMILQDDDAPQVNVSTTDDAFSEINGSLAKFFVSRTGATTNAMTVNYTLGGTATSGIDYTAPSGSVTIPAGAVGAYVDISMIDDTLAEGTETIVLNVTPVAGYSLGNGTATRYIADAEAASVATQVRFSASSSVAAENAGTVSIPVTLSAAAAGTVTVEYFMNGGTALGAGIDYTMTPGLLTFAPGEVTKNIFITLSTDTVTESTETFVVSLANPNNARLGTSSHTLSITDSASGPAITLADALDTTSFAWTTSGDGIWFPQTAVSNDGADAAQSGVIADSQNSFMETTIVGPGDLTFWWKISSESNYDFLRFYLDGVEQSGSLSPISGTVEWVQKTVSIPTGSRVVRWGYTKDSSVAAGLDAAWVDQVVFTPNAVPGSLAVTSGNLTSSGTFGGPFSPASLQYTLSNPGNTSINWTASKTATWVNLSATSGTLAAGANTTVTVSINSSANSLNVGSFTDTVTFANTTNGTGNTTRGVSLAVNPIVATVNLSNMTQTYDGSLKPVTVGTTPSGLSFAVTYAGSANPPTDAGTYAVVASVTQPNYSGSASGNLVISKAAQTITFGSLGNVLDDAAPFPLSATTTSGLTVSFASSNPAVATVSGNTVSIVGLGTTTITASQAGNANYNAATSVPQTLTVVPSNPLAAPGSPYKVLVGQSLLLNGSASQASFGETITSYEWDLNNDSTFGDVTGATPSAIPFATLTGTWGMVQGLNTIQLKITDSANKTSTVSTTVELIGSLTWDANGLTAGQTNGAGAWLANNLWWDGSANTNWVSGSNAVFGGQNTAGGAVTLASPTTVNSITFNQFTGTYTFGTSGQTLTLNGGIDKTSASAIVSIISPILLGANQTWTNNSASALSTSTGTNLITNDGYNLSVDGTGTVNFGVINNSAVALAGSGALIKNGSGRLNVGGLNSGFSGTVTINSGVLHAFNDGGALGNGNLTLNGGALSFYWGTTYTRALGNGAGQVQILGGESGFAGSGTSGPTVNLGTTVVWGALGEGSATGYFNPDKFVLGDAGTSSAGVVNFSSGINLNGATRTILVPKGLSTGGNVSTISGAISSAGAAGLVKDGAGTLILSAASSFTGPITISSGILQIGNNTAATLAGGTYANTISIASGSTFRMYGSANQTISGAISGSGGLTKSYAGTLTLSGPNTYSGKTSLTAVTTAGFGTVVVSSFNSVAGGTASSSLGTPTTVANGTIDFGSTSIQAGGTLRYIGSGETTDRVINFLFNGTGATKILDASGSGPLTFTSAFTGSGSVSNDITLTGTGVGAITGGLPVTFRNLSKTGTGTWTLGGPVGNTVLTTVTAGRLALGANDVLSDVAAVSIAAATLDVGNFRDVAGTLDVTAATSTINLGTGASLAFANSSAIDWTGGTLNLTGTFVPGSSLRFGTDSTGLTSGQLARISAPGFGPLVLNANGYLTHDATPPVVLGITDDKGGAPVSVNTAVTYTITFSEDMNDTTVTASDFGNAGTAAGIIGNVTEATPGVFLVSVMPTSEGTLRLKVNAGAALADVAGNALDTTMEIADDTIISVGSGNTAPVANSQGVLTAEDTALPITLTASDADGDTLNYTVLSLPANGVLSGTAPNLIYTPSANFNGVDSFTFRANDGLLDSAVATVEIAVSSVNDVPVAVAQNVTTAEETALAITLAGTDVDLDALTYAVVTPPANGTLSGTAPNLIFTPSENFNGTTSLSFKVNDGTVDSEIATVSITVTPVNDAPVANVQSITTDEDIATAITLSGSDVDLDTLNYVIVSQPANGTLSGTAPNFVYSPAENSIQPDSFTFKVNDGTVDSGLATVSITVTPMNDAPVANAQSVTTAEDAATAITLSGSDVDLDSISFAVVSQPANGTLSGTAPNLIFTPSENFNGTTSLSFKVNDGTVDSEIATVSITVTPVNDAPVANAQSITTDEDMATAVTLSGSDVDLDTLAYVIVSQPANGILSGSAPNLVYTPAANSSQPDSFSFKVNDGTVDSGVATVSITVTPVNDVPVANAQSVTTAEDTQTSIALSGSDVDGDPISYTVVSQPANGSLSGSGPNLTFTPASNFNGSTSFVFRVNDGTLDSATATISITVTPVNDAPVFITNPIVAVGGNEGVAYSGVTLAGAATDADGGDTITYSKVSGPEWLSVAANGSLSGTPPSGSSGLNSFLVRATDSASATAEATLEITIAGLPLPWTSADIGTGMLAGSATFNAGTFTQSGSGVIGGTSDKLRFTYQTLSGDGEITARISSLENTGNNSRVGVMIRESLAPNSKEIFMGMTGSNAYRWARRTTTGGSTSTNNSNTGTVPNAWVRLVRSGTTITAFKSTNGTSWTSVGSTTNTSFGTNCYIGLAVGSGSDTTMNTSQFGNVSVTP